MLVVGKHVKGQVAVSIIGSLWCKVCALQRRSHRHSTTFQRCVAIPSYAGRAFALTPIPGIHVEGQTISLTVHIMMGASHGL